MLRNQGVELGRDFVFAAAIQVRLEAMLDGGETQRVQPGGDRRDPWEVRQVRQSGSPPERERRGQLR